MQTIETIRIPTGRRIELLNPQFLSQEETVIEIATGLSREFRFGGNAYPYSVGQHSCSVASLLPPRLRYAGLFHDASEAYLRDIQKPLKNLLPDYQAIEELFTRRIGELFGIPYGDFHCKEVKEADHFMYLMEITYLPSLAPLAYTPEGEPKLDLQNGFDLDRVKKIWTVEETKAVFISTWKNLKYEL